MACGCIDGLRIARRRAVTSAIVGCAERRTALDYLARDTWSWKGRIVVLRFSYAARVMRRATRLAGTMGVTGGIPILGPLPDFAGHVVEAVPVGEK